MLLVISKFPQDSSVLKLKLFLTAPWKGGENVFKPFARPSIDKFRSIHIFIHRDFSTNIINYSVTKINQSSLLATPHAFKYILCGFNATLYFLTLWKTEKSHPLK